MEYFRSPVVYYGVEREVKMVRKSGVLLAISSLPSKYGIGCFSKEAYDFVDYLAAAGQSYWQVLPMGPTGYGDSPYQAFSTFAGNPYFIDLEDLIDRGWLTRKECDSVDFGDLDAYIDYEKIYLGRFKLLRKAHERSDIGSNPDFHVFCEEEKSWLNDYCLYRAIKEENGGKSFIEWPEKLRKRDKKELAVAKRRLAKEIEFYAFLQYMFMIQWLSIKDYANEKGIDIIGDIPIYVAYDSADTWARPELFLLDEDGYPTGVAGCPPDYFSATGQLWGNPLYDWDYHEDTQFEWWIERMAQCFKLYDMVRIDHFRGFDEYYNIPYGDPTAEFGEWELGPGFELFKTLREELGDKPIIAEDLGLLTKSVIRLVKRTGYPGMKILEFAFDSNEDNDYLPHNFIRNCVVYTGTHDNDTVQGWYASANRNDKKMIKTYLGVTNSKNLHWDMIRLAESSVADIAIIPMQDILGLGSEARMNIPSTLGMNWKWRLLPEQLKEEDAQMLYEMAKVYGRLNK